MTNPDTPQPKTPALLMQSLEWVYDKVSGTVPAAAASGTDAEIDQWIRLACLGSGGSGFVTNLGGVFTLPLAIPANLLGTATIQLGLASRIAAARGYQLGSPEIRAFAIASLVGVKAAEVLSGAGVKLGTKLAQSAISQISGATLLKINQAVGFRLLTKAGQQGAVNLAKFVPVAGGLVGGTIDAASTYAVGQAAKRLFPRVPTIPPPLDVPTPEGGYLTGPAQSPERPSVPGAT